MQFQKLPSFLTAATTSTHLVAHLLAVCWLKTYQLKTRWRTQMFLKWEFSRTRISRRWSPSSLTVRGFKRRSCRRAPSKIFSWSLTTTRCRSRQVSKSLSQRPTRSTQMPPLQSDSRPVLTLKVQRAQLLEFRVLMEAPLLTWESFLQETWFKFKT